MPLSPLCLVRDGAGPFVTTANGADVSDGASVSIKLVDTTGVVDWFLQVIGTDELSTSPTLVGVNGITHQVTSPSTIVTLTFPTGPGRAVGFRSEVTGVGGPIITTFGIYSLTTFLTRVGFVTETREGDSDFGWATKINPLIRSGGGGGGGGGPDNYTLTDVAEEKTIPEGQTMLFEDDVIVEDGGELVVLGGVTAIRTEDNFSMLRVPTRSERVVQENDEMLFTEDMRVDGQLTVDGQITDATPYDGDDILAALTAVAPITPTILGAPPVSFLTPAQARTVLDVPSFAEMNAAVGSSGLTLDPLVHHASFSALSNHTHYVWSADGFDKTITLPASPADGDRVELIGLSNGTDLVTIDNGAITVYYNADSPSNSGQPFSFGSAGLHVLLIFRTSAATAFGDGWFNASNSVTSQYGGPTPTANSVIVSGDTLPGQILAQPISQNSVLGRSTGGIISYGLLQGHLLFRSATSGLMGSYSPSHLNEWTPPIVGPGAFVLAVDRVNKYVATPSLTLQFPTSALDGDEIQIKEASSSAGTAPNAVTIDTTNPFVFVENIGLGGNTQADTLTEFKTWIKYKFDASGPVWRIVGAAYQLP